MILDEADSKALMRRYGVPTPRGEVARSPDEVPSAASSVGYPAVIKALVPFGGRGKLGA
ncbi:MAG TPA: succinate--CoA ligase subunit beta, partial [Armatimonadetes bacterium]|nr:succinate--CoA ligase subunit beta [Armatimonadota bacterium]